jgi:hypothetical protein
MGHEERRVYQGRSGGMAGIGGDGDNGETLTYELDEYFAAKDKEANNG